MEIIAFTSVQMETFMEDVPSLKNAFIFIDFIYTCNVMTKLCRRLGKFV